MKLNIATVFVVRYRLLSFAFGLAVFLAGSANAQVQGKLDAFEKDAASDGPQEHRSDHGSKSKHHDKNHRRDSDDSFSLVLWDMFMDGIRFAVVNGGECSWERISEYRDSEWTVEMRHPGEPLLPYARLDVVRQTVASDITATDLRAEAGYGPFAIHMDWTDFREAQPEGNLDIMRALALYRMSFSSRVEIDVGCGALTLNGEESATKFAFALPILIHPNKHWGLEFRPTWADRITDYDLAVMLTWHYASLKAGYRWLHTPNESLDGPYVGISVRL